jgi:HEAT repeat protein
MNDLLNKLAGGDRRSIGRSDEVVAEVLADPAQFPLVFEGLLGDDPLIRMRAADAVEKITARHPDYLQPYKNQLIEQVARINQPEVRWHAAQMLSRLEWSEAERAQVVEILLAYLEDASKIVKTFAMQALADLAEQHSRLRPQVIPLLEELTHTGSPAMQSRGRKLLRRLGQE